MENNLTKQTTEKNPHKIKVRQCPLAVEKHLWLILARQMSWGGLVGFFSGCWQLCDDALGGSGWGWAQNFLGCSAWHKAWRHWPACMDEVSGLKLVGSSFTSDLETLEFPLLQKWIILIHIQLKAWFSLRECWALQGAAVAKGRVLAWGLLPLGGSDWVSVAFKQMSY